jgi:hypothetical protein
MSAPAAAGAIPSALRIKENSPVKNTRNKAGVSNAVKKALAQAEKNATNAAANAAEFERQQAFARQQELERQQAQQAMERQQELERQQTLKRQQNALEAEMARGAVAGSNAGFGSQVSNVPYSPFPGAGAGAGAGAFGDAGFGSQGSVGHTPMAEDGGARRRRKHPKHSKTGKKGRKHRQTSKTHRRRYM